jgi:hypothetical protein
MVNVDKTGNKIIQRKKTNINDSSNRSSKYLYYEQSFVRYLKTQAMKNSYSIKIQSITMCLRINLTISWAKLYDILAL